MFVSTQILWRVSKDYCPRFGVLRRKCSKYAGMYAMQPGKLGFTKQMSSPSALHWGVHRKPGHLTMSCVNRYFHVLIYFFFRSLNMASATLQKPGASPPFKVIKCPFIEQIFTEHLLHSGSIFQSTQCGTLWHLSRKGLVFAWPLDSWQLPIADTKLSITGWAACLPENEHQVLGRWPSFLDFINCCKISTCR